MMEIGKNIQRRVGEEGKTSEAAESGGEYSTNIAKQEITFLETSQLSGLWGLNWINLWKPDWHMELYSTHRHVNIHAEIGKSPWSNDNTFNAQFFFKYFFFDVYFTIALQSVNFRTPPSSFPI